MLSHQTSNFAVERDSHKLRLWFKSSLPGILALRDVSCESLTIRPIP